MTNYNIISIWLIKPHSSYSHFHHDKKFTMSFLHSQSLASQVALVVKNLSANAGDLRGVGSTPGLEDPLEEGMATHSNILAWRTHGQRSLAGYSP